MGEDGQMNEPDQSSGNAVWSDPPLVEGLYDSAASNPKQTRRERLKAYRESGFTGTVLYRNDALKLAASAAVTLLLGVSGLIQGDSPPYTGIFFMSVFLVVVGVATAIQVIVMFRDDRHTHREQGDYISPAAAEIISARKPGRRPAERLYLD